MSKLLKKLITLLISIITISLHAQTGVGNEEVIVVKEYEVTIQDAQKVNIQPNIPEVEEVKPNLTYSVPPKDFKDISFEPNPLKPLSISKEKLEKYNSGFIKIGFGSQIMPIAQLAYNDNKTKNLKFGIFYNHLSAREFKVRNQRFVDDEVGVYLKYFPKTLEVGTDFTFRNFRTHFYGTGGDTTLSDSVIKAKDVRQVFRTYNASFYIKNAQRNKYDIDFLQSVRFNYLQETFGKASEWYITGTTDIMKSFLTNHSAGFKFNFDISKLKNDSLTLQRNIFTPMVGYKFNDDDWKAHGFIGVAVDGNKAYLATDVHLEKRLYEHMLIAYTTYTHNLFKNSLLTYSQTNQWIQNWVDIKNSTAGDFGIGLKGTIQNFNYNAAFHLNHIKNLPLFINDTLDTKRFVVIYEPKAIIYNVHFESGYNMKEWLRLSVLGDLNMFQVKTEARAWHEPTFRLTLRANYIWKSKIVVGLDLYGITTSYARLAAGQEKKLKGTADVNLSIEYLMNKHIAFFGNLNNIANVRYQRWNSYSSYGINGNVGAKFSF
ncbi:MAG: hypothetical protein U0T74_10855 [Chitinophagales bacterium]